MKIIIGEIGTFRCSIMDEFGTYRHSVMDEIELDYRGFSKPRIYETIRTNLGISEKFYELFQSRIKIGRHQPHS